MKYNLKTLEKKLPNGLQVILAHKPDYAKSFFMMGVPAGGFNIVEEKDGKVHVNPSGAAHFLEHQMFRLDGKDVTDDFSLMQAQTNAFTSYTETCYYFTTTANPEEPLKLLMDFVQQLDISQESIDKEKGIIVSEYNMYNQQPESRLLRETFRSLYEKHPLRNEILGEVEDIENMSEKNLRTFYETSYDPSRLVLVGVTGRDVNHLMEVIEKHEEKFKSISSQNVIRLFDAEPDEVARERFETAMDISTPYVCIAYKFREASNIWSALKTDLCISIWLDTVFGPMNPDYQNWLDEHIISQAAGAEADFTEDHGYMMFYAQTNKADEFIELIEHLVQKKDISEEDFHSLKAQNMARNFRSLDNFESLAIDLFRSRQEGYDYIEAMDMVRTLTSKDVMDAVANLDFSHRTVTIIRPENS